MKFKKGDRVRVVDNISDPWFDRYIGKIATVVDLGNYCEDLFWLNLPEERGRERSVWAEEELEKITVGRPKKEPVIRYVVVRASVASAFASRKELMIWLREAREDSNVDWDSIRVFDVKKEMRVLTSLELRAK